MSYFSSRMAAVEFVDEKLRNSKPGSPLIMTIGRDRYGDYYAHSVIDESLDVTDLTRDATFLREVMSTSQENTPAG